MGQAQDDPCAFTVARLLRRCSGPALLGTSELEPVEVAVAGIGDFLAAQADLVVPKDPIAGPPQIRTRSGIRGGAALRHRSQAHQLAPLAPAWRALDLVSMPWGRARPGSPTTALLGAAICRVRKYC